MKFEEKFKNAVGKKIGKWIILNKAYIMKNKAYYVYCACECGAEKLVSFYSMLAGQSNGCKKCRLYCLRGIEEWKRLHGSPNKKSPGLAAFNKLFNRYRGSARHKKLEFNLNKEEFKKFTTNTCHYCGCVPKDICGGAEFNGNYIYNGIDRKNNNLGYIAENCLPCCSDCNYLKRDRNYEDFLSLIYKISENTKNEKKS